MKQIEVTLISGRTIEQGTSLELGKTSDPYFENVATVFVSVSDAETLGLGEGDTVELTTSFGSVAVTSHRSEDLEPGQAFIPYGPWANRLFGSYTGGTGMPLLKTIKATMRPAKDRGVPSISELVEFLRGVA